MSITELLGRLVGLDDITRISEGYAIIITSILIVIGWHISNLTQLYSDMNRNAYELGEINSNNTIKQHLRILSANINSRMVFRGRESIDADVRSSLSATLNHLEYIATAARVGYVSERYLVLTNSSMISLIFIISRVYISEIRSLRGVRSFYRNYEILYVRNFFKSKSLLISVPEIIFGRKLFLASYVEFRINYYIMRKLLSLPKKYLDCDQYLLKKMYFYYKNSIRVLILYFITIWCFWFQW